MARNRAGLGADALMLGAVALALAPFVLILLASVKDIGDVIRNPLSWPAHWHWSNFPLAWRQGHFSRYFVNSLIVTIPTVAAIVSFSLLAAYAFAQMRFRGRTALFVLFMIGLTVPLDILIIPLFYQMLSFGLLNTVWALIFPQIAIGLPFGILLLRSFIEGLPQEIFEAAVLDGCSRARILRHIVAPMCRPAIVTLCIFNFMWTWNQFLLPVVLIQNDDARTLPVGLNFFSGRYLTDVPLLMAGTTITFLPVVLVYILFQRQFMKGIAASALK